MVGLTLSRRPGNPDQGQGEGSVSFPSFLAKLATMLHETTEFCHSHDGDCSFRFGRGIGFVGRGQGVRNRKDAMSYFVEEIDSDLIRIERAGALGNGVDFIELRL